MLSRVLLLLLRLVVEQEGEVVSATNVVDVDADSDTELSPRTRRILAHELGVTILMGTTSAYAENTADDVYVALHQRNYLRVRGEYDSFSSSAAFAWELPPRTRRIHDPGFAVGASPGTTSAYAENTVPNAADVKNAGNYLRVRGEYAISSGLVKPLMELPPRTRRILDRAQGRNP